MIYNSVIIGAGPAGLAYANYAKKHNPNEKIIILEKDKTIGGCHKVNRKKYENNNYFCEHGPRAYFNNYVNFISLLKSMKLDFKDLFVKRYSMIEFIYKSVMKDNFFGFSEFLKITRDFILILFDNTHGINLSVYDYMISNNFNNKSIINIDFLCRTLDGGDSSRISLNSFLNSTIQMFLYSIYTPRKPNDEGLFLYWRRFLEQKKVKFQLNADVKEIISKDDKIEAIILNNGNKIVGDKFIFAIPPANFLSINGLKEAFNLKDDYIQKTEYSEYISISFHWDFKLDLEEHIKISNIKTEWYLITANMSSDFMNFKEPKSKTVISCAIVLTDVKGRYTNKTANECNEEELIKEVYEQLRLIYKNIPKPTIYFINNYYNNDLRKWEGNETAYLKVPKYDYIDFKSKKYKNLYCLGTHNGKHKNSFTSLESAISNSIKLSNIIFNKKDKIKRCFDLRDLIIVIMSIILLLLIIKYTYAIYK